MSEQFATEFIVQWKKLTLGQNTEVIYAVLFRQCCKAEGTGEKGDRDWQAEAAATRYCVECVVFLNIFFIFEYLTVWYGTKVLKLLRSNKLFFISMQQQPSAAEQCLFNSGISEDYYQRTQGGHKHYTHTLPYKSQTKDFLFCNHIVKGYK